MTRHAHPTTALPDPGVGKAAMMDIGFSVERSLFVVGAVHDYTVTVNTRFHRIVADDLNVLNWVLDAVKELTFAMQAAIDINISEVVS